MLVEKKENLKNSIPLIALFSTIEAILVILGTYVPFLYIGVIFLLFIPSTLLASLIKARYYPIYFVSCLIICLLVGFGDISFCIVYLFPSLIISFLFSLSFKNILDIKINLIISSLIYFLIQLGLIYFVKDIFEIDIISKVLTLFSLEDNLDIKDFIYLSIYLINIVEILFTLLITYLFLKKFNLSLYSSNKFKLLFLFFSILSTIISFLFIEYKLNISYLFFGINFFIFFLFLFNEMKSKNYLNLIIIPAVLLVLFFTFTYLNLDYEFKKLFLIYELISPLFISISLLINLIGKRNKNRFN